MIKTIRKIRPYPPIVLTEIYIMLYGQDIYTLSTSGAVPYRYKLFRYSLDRYGTTCVYTCSGTGPIHLSTLQTERTKLYQNSLFRSDNYKIYTLSILAFLDRYGTGTVLIHLSTSVNASLIPHDSVPIRSDPRPSILWGSFRNKLFRYSLVRSVCNVDRWIGTVPEQVWTQTVTYRSKLYRNSLYRYGIDPDMDRVTGSRIGTVRNERYIYR